MGNPPERDPLSDTWPEEIDARVAIIEARVRVVSAGHAQLTDQIAEIVVSQHRAEEARKLAAQRMDDIQSALIKNTELTSKTLEAAESVRDLVTTARTGGRFFRWLAPTLIAVGLAIGTVKGWWLSGLEIFNSIPPEK